MHECWVCDAILRPPNVQIWSTRPVQRQMRSLRSRAAHAMQMHGAWVGSLGRGQAPGEPESQPVPARPRPPRDVRGAGAPGRRLPWCSEGPTCVFLAEISRRTPSRAYSHCGAEAAHHALAAHEARPIERAGCCGAEQGDASRAVAADRRRRQGHPPSLEVERTTTLTPNL